ncbi:MAG: hypothetical protein AAFN30_14365, partial [Actinomycetota bacterium]
MTDTTPTRRRQITRTLSPYEQLRNEVTEGIKDARLDPETDPQSVRDFVLAAIDQWQSVARKGLDGKELLVDGGEDEVAHALGVGLRIEPGVLDPLGDLVA